MTEIVVAPATSDRFDDAQHALTGGGDGRSCQCQWWTLTNPQWQASTQEERHDLLRAELAADDAPPPALIAYVDGEAAGWIRVGPRVSQPRLSRTRAISQNSAEPLDDADVWAVTCFVVRREHRGKGLNHVLLAAAVNHARAHGARIVEAYPTDTAVSERRSNELFEGILSVFEEAGFREVARPKPGRVIVVHDLKT